MALQIASVIIFIIVVLAVVVLVRTFTFKPPQAAQGKSAWEPDRLDEEALRRLSAAIRIKTISSVDYDSWDFTPFDQFKSFLQEAFPLFHEQCKREVVNGYALIYRWQGSDESLLPIALMAHYDVVPVEEGTEDDWQHPPFAGEIADGIIWGRGTLDIKSQLLAYLEAAERLMRSGFQPQRGVYFCFGHDEETGGAHGTQRTVAHLREQGVRFEAVLDEGGTVVSGALKGVEVPIALIGIAEKGTSNYELSLEGEGGHSSMPPTHTSLGLAARLITQIENHPLPLSLTPPVELMLRSLSGQMGFAVRLAVANLWLMRPLLLRVLAASSVTNALVRTTFAVTQAKGSDACNVLPQQTTIRINVRLLSGDTVASVNAYFAALAAKSGVSVRITPVLQNEASPISPIDTPFYASIQGLLSQIYPNAIASPYLVAGGTDSRYFYALSNNVYRLSPVWITEHDRTTIHSTNESLSAVNYERMIHFYELLLREL
ncbi:MAG: M20 family peptidase [Coriobacteriales bacterium]|jgi:carboxypeptidase PM20D1|nr:M20 family peptidase [Coriobacteriales bacterium]